GRSHAFPSALLRIPVRRSGSMRRAWPASAGLVAGVLGLALAPPAVAASGGTVTPRVSPRPPAATASAVVKTSRITLVLGDVVRVTRKDAGRFWAALDPRSGAAARTTHLAGGIAKVWLDGKVKASLDQSVPLIGAPEAWQQGLDGTGVTVAVLDTGIDAGHAD